MSAVSNIVYQRTASTGAGAISLAALAGYRSFYAAFGTGGSDMFFYCIRHTALNEWEVGTGHLSDAATLVRDTVIASSNAGAAVDFSAGDKDVVNDIPAERQLPLPAAPEAGDLLRYDGSKWQRLPRGAAGDVLKSTASTIGWAAAEMADIDGLSTALAAKADSSHGHGMADITDLAATLAGKAAATHAHAITDVTDLAAVLSGKASTAHGHGMADITGLAAALADVASASHTHVVGDVTGLQSALNGKADTSHSHDSTDITDLAAVLAGYSPTARSISAAGSLSGGGDLSADRSLQLQGDADSPGNNRFYGTDGSGTKGFHALPESFDAENIIVDDSALHVIAGADAQTVLAATDAALQTGGFMPDRLIGFHHMAGNIASSIFAAAASGTGAAADTVDTHFTRNEDALGIVKLATGTTASGCALRGLGAAGMVLHRTGKTLRLRSRIRLEDLTASGSQEFCVWGGITTTTAANTNPYTTTGAYWFYDKNNANWQFRRRFAGTDDVVDTGVTVVADTWYDMDMVVTGHDDEMLISIALFINGAAAGSLSALPVYTSYNAVSAAIQKKLGTTARSLYIDYEALFMARSA